MHLGVQNGASLLNSLIVSTTDDLSIQHQHRANRNTPSSEAQSSLLDGGLNKWLMVVGGINQ